MNSPITPSNFDPLSPGNSAADTPKTRRRWGLWAAAAAFAGAMIFLLGARSIELVAVAEGEASFNLSGLHIPFGQRHLLWAGDYQVQLEVEGYHRLEDTITVGDGSAQRFEFHPRPLPGLVTLNSQPAGAEVFVNGKRLGVTPLPEIELEAGEHPLELRAERYFPLHKNIAVTGRTQRQELQFQLEPAWAVVALNSQPAGATVVVAGQALGQTPWRGELLQGEHEVELNLAAYSSWRNTVTVVAGEDQSLPTVTLEPAAGLLQLTSRPSGANVTVDGEFRGQTPLAVELAPERSHRIGLSKPGYQRQTLQRQLAAGAQSEENVELQAQLGDVQFQITPSNAQLLINGKVRGTGNQRLSLPTVNQRMEVRLAGYATVRRQVTPRQGLEQVVSITLQTEAEARAARIKPEITSAVGQTLLLFDPVASGHSEFTLGASRREPGRRANEVLHPVQLTRAFYLQTTEVTNAQFRQFQSEHHSGQIEGNSLNRDHQPVVAVSWQQAAQFCNWLSRREGLPVFYRETQGVVTGYNPSATGYRLPTEAEWAWAARMDGGKLRKFPWGNTFPPTTVAENYADNTSARITGRFLAGYTDGHVVAAPVASFAASHHKLYDMGGNVAEWTHDVYTIPSANAALAIDPLGAQTGDNYVIRGASWSHSKIGEIRLSYRDYGQRGRDDVGFRLARYAE
jgi:formylglycine-generating enzyme required for sulfatase activity